MIREKTEDQKQMILVNDQKEAKQKNLKKEDQNPSVGINPDRTIKDQNESEN